MARCFRLMDQMENHSVTRYSPIAVFSHNGDYLAIAKPQSSRIFSKSP
ncbi:MAG: hypothetical protein WA783_00785 [Phormidesmis sp.]